LSKYRVYDENRTPGWCLDCTIPFDGKGADEVYAPIGGYPPTKKAVGDLGVVRDLPTDLADLFSSTDIVNTDEE
jgi:hypothetical protein